MGRDRETDEVLVNPFIEIERFNSRGNSIGVVTLNASSFAPIHQRLIHPLDEKGRPFYEDCLYRVWAVVGEYDRETREVYVLNPRSKAFLGFLEHPSVRQHLPKSYEFFRTKGLD